MLRAYIIQLKFCARCLYHVVLNIHFLDFNELCWLKITCSIHLILRTNDFSNNEPFFFFYCCSGILYFLYSFSVHRPTPQTSIN